MDSTLSAYELQRLDNIARNKEVLTSLGLQAVITPAAPKRTKPKAARPPTAPSRKSGRLASVPAPSVYVDSERSNGMVMLGGADAAEVAATSARSDLVAAAEAPTDEDPAPDAEEQLFPSEAKARALAASLFLTQLTCSLTCKLTSPSPLPRCTRSSVRRRTASHASWRRRHTTWRRTARSCLWQEPCPHRLRSC